MPTDFITLKMNGTFQLFPETGGFLNHYFFLPWWGEECIGT